MTENHNYNTPEDGESDWHILLNENFEAIDSDVEVRDTESRRPLYEPLVGTKFLATDTGNIHIGDGEQWQQLATTGPNPEFDTASAERTSVFNRDNEINVRASEGDDLAERVRAALGELETAGTIRIPRPEGGGRWQWTSRLDIDTDRYSGVTLDFDRGVEVEYTGDDWAIVATGPADRGQRQTFAIDGVDAEFVATGDPSGFIRADDVSHLTVKINTRFFANNAGDATAVLIRNVDRFSEGWKLEGDHRGCDRGVDFAPAAITGGSGGPSFLDGRAENLSVNGSDFGMRLRGNHKSNVFDNVHFFINSDSAVGLVLAGVTSNTVFIGSRWDDTQSFENDIAIKTTDEFKEYDGRPLFISPEFANISKTVSKADEAHGIWSLTTRENKIGLTELGSGSGIFCRGSGELEVRSDAETTFRIGSDGNIHEAGNWQTGTAPTFVQGMMTPAGSGPELVSEDLTTRDPTGDEVAKHDGSGFYSESLCFERSGSWYNILDSQMM